MSNRKYAALLEGSAKTEKERLDDIIKILAEHANDLYKSVETQDWFEPGQEIENGFQSIISGKFKTMAPELAEKYKVIVGIMPKDEKYEVVIGYRPKWVREGRPWVDNAEGIVGNLTISSDDIIRAINHSHESTYIDASHITAGSITANTIQAGAITANTIRVRDWAEADVERWPMPTRDVPTLRITERYGMGIVNTGGQATFTVEGTLR